MNLEKIVEIYTPYIYSIIINMDCNKKFSNEDIEEIMSDIFWVLWKNKEKLDKEKILSSYIAGVTKNVVKKKYRYINIVSNIEEFENTLVSNSNIDEILEQREKNRIIHSNLNKFKLEDKQIFNMFYYSSMSTKEIALKLGLNDFTVRTKLHRIRKQLKKDLIESGYGNEF